MISKIFSLMHDLWFKELFYDDLSIWLCFSMYDVIFVKTTIPLGFNLACREFLCGGSNRIVLIATCVLNYLSSGSINSIWIMKLGLPWQLDSPSCSGSYIGFHVMACIVYIWLNIISQKKTKLLLCFKMYWPYSWFMIFVWRFLLWFSLVMHTMFSFISSYNRVLRSYAYHSYLVYYMYKCILLPALSHNVGSALLLLPLVASDRMLDRWRLGEFSQS